MKKYSEIFVQFFYLGLISFGGPVAHIAYFQKTFVEKLKWVEPQTYAGLIGLSQFLPGPGSSQVGFAIGHERAGAFGGIAAFIGFTLPSFLIMYFLANLGSEEQLSQPIFVNVISMLKILAVVVVADAVLSMFTNFCKNNITISIAFISAVTSILVSGLFLQVLLLLAALIFGAINQAKIQQGFLDSAPAITHSNIRTELKNMKVFSFSIFVILLFGLPLLANVSKEISLFSDFYYVGSLVFGGGHVVLPMLQEVTTSIDNDTFLLGYAAAQAIPGPMFTFATYLGGELLVNSVFIGAFLATLAVFLPGFLLIVAFKDSWKGLAKFPRVAGAMVAINAAVVGLLMSAFYKPVLISAIHNHWDVVTALVGFWAVRYAKLPIIAIVITYVAIGIVKSL
ncbi:chromate efflux transporter [Psychrosphaera haliotis]|uniref:Chromate efflux transporter n=1 Tax=Psychrosphaera haliotis TaxID=555083 RepID=A0A6N8F9C3_9GAMM|nr:chromate efflux transporter [Psychrosphaera haliotis]MUH71677.1 chromate efflux transporter [Psychrosphaera haliotis]